MNVLNAYNATVESRIDDKESMYSISKEDVGQSLRDIAKLALLVPQSDVNLTYPKDYLTRDSTFALFVALQDDVNGDTTNGSNWQRVSGGGGGSSTTTVTITCNGTTTQFPFTVNHAGNGVLWSCKSMTDGFYDQSPIVSYPDNNTVLVDISQLVYTTGKIYKFKYLI